MAEEVNYASVVFKASKQAPPEAKKEETVYDEVKVTRETTEQTADTNDEKENNKRRCYQKLARCLGILCGILLVGLVAVVVVFATSSDENNETTLKAEIDNLTNLIDKLNAEMDNLTVELSNLKENYNFLENNITNLTTQNQELKNERNNLTQEIQNMEQNWNEHNISRAQWTIDKYYREEKGDKEKRCHACKQGWDPNGNNCYVYHDAKPPEQKTWEEARKECRGKSSDLAVGHTEEGKDAINEYSRWGKYWIGLRVEEGIWRWIDGTVQSDSSWIEEPIKGHCAVSESGLKWTSAPCDERKQWICVQGALTV